jgi:hypothetical protein
MTEEKRKEILVETVRKFGKQQWFRDATIYDAHPVTGEATLEFKVNYVPLFERKYVKEFVLQFNLADRFVQVDQHGNPIE